MDEKTVVESLADTIEGQLRAGAIGVRVIGRDLSLVTELVKRGLVIDETGGPSDFHVTAYHV